MRQAAARAVVESMRTIPHFYVSAEADMAAALDLRAQLNAADAQISINDVILKAAALALRRHPDLNAQFVAPDRMRRFRRVHLGIMVAVPGGLVAPVLRDADRLPLVALAQAARRLIERARARQLGAEELQGATFSVSNLGQFPVTQFAAIVHPPEAAILAVGRIQERARVRDGALALRPVLTMTVAADHRITDGAGVAEFLATVQHLLEHPILLSMT
jgi:pyruvate dehydrogenase E2 component (dihydrolipoamide acetyltransferase)